MEWQCGYWSRRIFPNVGLGLMWRERYLIFSDFRSIQVSGFLSSELQTFRTTSNRNIGNTGHFIIRLGLLNMAKFKQIFVPQHVCRKQPCFSKSLYITKKTFLFVGMPEVMWHLVFSHSAK